MEKQSRSAKSMKNSVFALGFTLLNLVVQFFSRKIFLEYLGTEILGLNTTAMNLLQFLNLAELGISAAVGFSLYKPLYDRDRDAVSDIISLQGMLYRRIAWLIIGGAAILMCFFPLIFAKITLPMWYAYASFGVLLFSALLGYFCNYRQVLLTANQQDYKVTYSFKSVMIAKAAAQMLAMYLFSEPYIWWLVLEVLFAVIASVTLSIVTRRNFPWLCSSKKSFKTLNALYPELSKKIKQLFFHKIGSFVLTQTSPLVIYAFTTLTLVTLYGNYMMIIQGVTLVLGSLYNSISASVGNLIAEKDHKRNITVFYELLASQVWIGMTISFGIYNLGSDFITLWIGKEYLLSNTILGILTLTFFLNTARLNVGAFISGFGLFGDIWAPIAEAALNLGLSILLGYFFGLPGILSGIAISVFAVIFCWKTYYVFTRALHASLWQFCLHYIKFIIIGGICWASAIAPTQYLETMLKPVALHSLQTFMFSIFTFVGMMIFDKHMQLFTVRLKTLLFRK